MSVHHYALIHTYIHTYTHRYMYTYMCVCVCVRMCVCLLELYSKNSTCSNFYRETQVHVLWLIVSPQHQILSDFQSFYVSLKF